MRTSILLLMRRQKTLREDLGQGGLLFAAALRVNTGVQYVRIVLLRGASDPESVAGAAAAAGSAANAAP